ncbi:MAG TPA: DNA translocase FtsK, partial [Acidobacteriaceae bacterium]|nr:DNA translocase FtsK [Acidobacteriaceae bacterium]
MKPIRFAFTPSKHRRANELIGVVLLVGAVLLFLALATYTSADPSLNTVSSVHTANNWTGIVGAIISDITLQLLGLTAFFLPVMLGAMGVLWLRSRVTPSPVAKFTGGLLWLAFLPVLLALVPGHLRWMHAIPIEGLTGRLLADTFIQYLNLPGALIIAAAMVVIAAYLSTAFSFSTARDWFAVRLAFFYAWRDRYANWKLRRARAAEEKRLEAERRRQEKEARKAEKSGRKHPVQAETLPIAATPLGAHAQSDESVPRRRAAFAEVAAAAPSLPYDVQPEPAPTMWNTMPRAKMPVLEPEPEPTPVYEKVAQTQSASTQTESVQIGTRADAAARPVTLTAKNANGFKLPPSSLLHRSEDRQVIREEELREEARILVEKCAEFDVHGQITQINPGPVVTTFELRPDAGVKYSRVTGLAEDLCLAMRAESILIERMAGKSTVGIQVPNHERETIWLRDVIEDSGFVGHKSKLTLAMGKDINGRIVTADLATMPHVLIAGSTGSGKSVAINAMIMSVLYKATPEQVRMILVDPKRVELGMYEGIPHLFTPIITEPKLAANALRNAVREMERRLKLLASRSVRNIDQYNRLFENGTPSLFEETDDQTPLPYIIIIIDELADLMMLDKSNVEEAITRLAQMARAVGIHLVLATQRPSVDVITGLIKANVPTRMSFRLATKVDSRTILDSNGAESLLGRGDMLFLPPGTSRLQRVHAPFVTEKEISAVVDFWKKQGEAEYVQGFLESPRDEKGRDLDGEGDADGSHDELFEDGVRLVLEFGK